MSDHAPAIALSSAPALAARPVWWALPALVLGAALVGASPIFVRLSETGPGATAFWRVILATPLFWLWMRSARTPDARRLPSGLWRRLAAAGLFFTGDLATWHWSIHFTSIANSTLFANFAPVFVTIGAWLLFRERPTLPFLAGLALTIGGAAALIGGSFELGGDHALGDGLALITAAFLGAYLLTVKDLRARMSAPALMFWSSLLTAAGLLVVAVLSRETLLPVTSHGWLILLALAWSAQAAGQGLITLGIGHLPVALSSIIILAEPVAGALFGWLMFNEGLGGLHWLGGVLVLAGITVAKRGEDKKHE